MAGETSLSSLNSDVSAAAAAGYALLLADRNWIGNLATLMYAGRINDLRSNVLRFMFAGFDGYSSTASTAEVSGASNTAIADTQVDVTVGKSTLIHQPSDIVRMTFGSVINPARLAESAVASGAATLTDGICGVIDDFTATAGPGSGVDLDVPSLLAAVGKTMTLNLPPDVMPTGILHGQQWSDVTVDSASTGGAIQFLLANSDLLRFRPGNKGVAFGIDWYESNRVVTANAGADRAGAIFSRTGVLWGDGIYVAEDMNQLALGNTLFERQRVAASGLTSYVTHVMIGVSKGLEAGVTVISDA